MKRSRWMLLLVFVLPALALAACGGGDDETSAGSEASGATEASNEAAEGGEEVVPAPPTTPPEKMVIDTPLKEAPPKGKKVIFMQCELPECERFVGGMEGATEALGWDLEVQVFDSAEPGKGLQSAISQNPDFIAITGVPTSVMEPQLAAAASAGIPVVSCSTPDKPEKGGYVAQCGGTLQLDAEYVGRWMANDAGGEAHILGLTLPMYPVLATQTEWLKNELPKECSGCTYDELALTPDDIAAGSVPQEVVGFLQGHPDINYVYGTFSDIVTGLPEVLQSAGLAEQVQITGCCAAPAVIEQVPDPMAAWTISPNEYNSWVMVDALARTANGEQLPADYQEKIYQAPAWVVQSEESRELLKPYGYDWPGPGNGAFRETFEELWQVK